MSFELALAFVLALAAAALLGLVGPAVLWLATRVGARLEERALAAKSTLPLPSRATPVDLLPGALAGIVVAYLYEAARVDLTAVAAIAPALGATTGLAAIALHCLPGHSRRTKYDLALFSQLQFATLLQLGQGITPLALAVGQLVLVVTATSAAHVAILPNEPFVPGAPRARFALLAHRATSMQLPAFRAALVLVLLQATVVGPAVFIAFRYCARHRVATRPVLYFRPFGTSPIETYTEVVVPVILRWLDVDGLVHVRQRSSVLQAVLPMSARRSFSAADDESWRAWVRARLLVASAVIVDLRGANENVSWEATLAHELCKGRVLELVPPTSRASRRRIHVVDPIRASERIDEWLLDEVLGPYLGEAVRWKDPIWMRLLAGGSRDRRTFRSDLAQVFVASSMAALAFSLPASFAFVLRNRHTEHPEHLRELFEGSASYYEGP